MKQNTMKRNIILSVMLSCLSGLTLAQENTAPNVGFRIFTKINRPDPELIQGFRNIPVANISDMMNRTKVVDARVHKINKNNLLGPAFTVKVRSDDNLMAHKAISMAQPGDIIVIDAEGKVDNAIIGEQMVRAAIQRKLGGIIVDGAVRDSDYLANQTDIPVYAAGITPAGPYKDGPGEINTPISVGGVVVNPGDILVGDDDGIVVIEPKSAKYVLEQAQKKNAAEAKSIEQITNGSRDHSWIDKALKEKSVQIIDDVYK